MEGVPLTIQPNSSNGGSLSDLLLDPMTCFEGGGGGVAVSAKRNRGLLALRFTAAESLVAFNTNRSMEDSDGN